MSRSFSERTQATIIAASSGVCTGSCLLLSLCERLGEGPDFVGIATGWHSGNLRASLIT